MKQPNKIVISTSSYDVDGNTALERASASGLELICNPYGRRLSESEARDLLKDGVIGVIAGVEPLTRDVLAAAKHLRVISRCGIGIDNVDMEAAAGFGIVVRNTPDAPGRAVAELTIGLMLALARRIPQADRGIRASRWKQLMGNLLSEQTIGLIGYGRIGKRVAGILCAMGATVLVHDPYSSSMDTGVTACSLEQLLAQSDVVSLHVPYSTETRHLMDERRLNAMKPGALLINASRGGLVDEEALYAALSSGHLGGAALDCFENEPYEGPLRTLDQVVMTAHMGSYAKEARALMEREAAENLMQALTERGCLNTR